MAGGDLVLLESLGHFGDKLQQRHSCINVALALTALEGECGNVITGKVQEPLISCGLFVRVYVLPLTVLYDLYYQGLCIVEVEDADRNLVLLRDLGGTEAPCSGQSQNACLCGER
jgi:hypothetical protein